MKKSIKIFLPILMLASYSSYTFAQDLEAEIQKYRESIADGNPAELYEIAGEELWKTPAGPKNQTMEKCDLGLGEGVVKGAAAQLPRYFPDTKKVQALESRLLTCFEELQGIPPSEFINTKFLKGKMETMAAIVAYVVTHSKGEKINVSTDHPLEQKMYDLGKKAFFYRAGTMDFSCASCHARDKIRIRAQKLPNLTNHEGAAKGWGSWPAYRVSSGTMWTMQHRLNSCYRQQRFPYPIYASDVTTALQMYMAVTANGGIVKTPGLKR